ncbi:MAG TPA: hypothetical protein VGM27_30855 [Acidobacteriaceae bacterium]|jgi:hypothetical protein
MMKVVRYLSIASIALALTISAMANDAPQRADTGHLVVVSAELQTSINAKTAKVGDLVTAKLTASVQIPGGRKLRGGTLLLGRIDQVQAAENSGTSTVVLTFDKAQPKDGQLIPIKSTIVGVSTDGAGVFPPSVGPHFQFEEEPTSKHGYSVTSAVLSSNSGVFKASGKNVHLKQGTDLGFAIASTATDSTVAGNN